jgi:hypothetical protein
VTEAPVDAKWGMAQGATPEANIIGLLGKKKKPGD